MNRRVLTLDEILQREEKMRDHLHFLYRNREITLKNYNLALRDLEKWKQAKLAEIDR